MNELPSREQTHLPQPQGMITQRLSNIPCLVGKKSTNLNYYAYLFIQK